MNIEPDNVRKLFQSLPGDENPHFMEDGMRIYREMRIKYPEESTIDLDNILNGLCAALLCLIRNKVDKSNHKYILQIIWRILNNSLE